jgi:hypothetical protein
MSWVEDENLRRRAAVIDARIESSRSGTNGHRPVPNTGPASEDGREAPPLFRRWTMQELLSADRTFRWDVRGMFAHPTYGQTGGGKKTLKTHITTMIDVGIASGIPILGHFGIDRPGPVVVYMGEGGRLPFTRLLERIARSMGADLADLPIFPTFDRAPIGSVTFNDSLRRDLEEVEPVLVHLDPLYNYHPAGVKASNLFEEGPMLAELSGICMQAETTLNIVNHFNKTGTGTGLDRITQSGAQEWSDSWILLSHRRDPNIDEGKFWLTMEIGSRQWGGSTWELDLDLGRFDVDRGEFDGSISWDLHRGTSKSAGEDDPVRTKIVDLVHRERWSLTRNEIVARVGGNAINTRKVFDAAVLADEIGCTEGYRKGQKGRTYTTNVYGPPSEKSRSEGMSESPAEIDLEESF